MKLHHQRHDEQGHNVDDLDQGVDGRASCVFVGKECIQVSLNGNFSLSYVEATPFGAKSAGRCINLPKYKCGFILIFL